MLLNAFNETINVGLVLNNSHILIMIINVGLFSHVLNDNVGLVLINPVCF